jgi:hypothetical protein
MKSNVLKPRVVKNTAKTPKNSKYRVDVAVKLKEKLARLCRIKKRLESWKEAQKM